MRRLFPVAVALTLLWGAAEAASSNAYRVQPGDTLSGIAERSGVSMAAIRAVNPRLKNTTEVQSGWVLVIPSRQLPARTHQVTAGQNLTVIAQKYGLTLNQLLKANPEYQGGKNLWVGAQLKIPARTANSGGNATVRPASTTSNSSNSGNTPARATSPTPTASYSNSKWTWPVSGYTYVSSDFGRRNLGGSSEMHYGIDIVAPVGTPVRAARAGRVLESRPDYDRGWGWTVVIQHEDGWITRYAHLSANLTKKGEWVVRGQRIGRVGDTGRSTGPHLHFGTYYRWNPRDPMKLY